MISLRDGPVADSEPLLGLQNECRGWCLDGGTRVAPWPPNPLDVGSTLDLT